MQSLFAELFLMALAVACVYRETHNMNYTLLTASVLVLDLKRRPRKERVVPPAPPTNNAVKVGRYTSTTQ